MPICRGCGEEFPVEALERHENAGLVHVHCPDCGRVMGTYNRRARDPTSTDG